MRWSSSSSFVLFILHFVSSLPYSELQVAALILENTFTSILDMAGVLLPFLKWFIGGPGSKGPKVLNFLVRSPWSTIDVVGKVGLNSSNYHSFRHCLLVLVVTVSCYFWNHLCRLSSQFFSYLDYKMRWFPQSTCRCCMPKQLLITTVVSSSTSPLACIWTLG